MIYSTQYTVIYSTQYTVIYSAQYTVYGINVYNRARGAYPIKGLYSRVFLKTLFIEFASGQPGNHVSSY